MQGLLYKEFIQNKQNLCCLFISIFLISMSIFIKPAEDADVPEEAYALLGMFVYVIDFFLLNSFQPSFFQMDENKKWSYFAVSTPEGVNGVVWSKYVFAFMVSGIVLILCYILDNISMMITGNETNTFMIYVLCFFVHIFLSAIDIPFMLRFGTKAGTLYRGILFLLVVFAFIIYGLFGDLSIFDSIDNFYDRIIAMMDGTAMSDGLLLAVGIFMHVSVLLYYLSYRISCKYYLKGVSCYDK